jgi:hypothetical protein
VSLRPTCLAGAAGLLALSAGVARAQTSAFLDVGSGSASYDGLPGTTLLAVSPTLVLERPRWSAVATGAWTRFERGGWSGQGTLAASWFAPALGPVTTEWLARGDHTVRAWGAGTGQAVGQLRVHLFGAGRGLWIGGTGGAAWRGAARDGVVRGDLGAWARLAEGRVTVSLLRGRAFDSVPVAERLDAIAAVVPARAIGAFTEAQVTLDWAEGPMEVVGALARRVTPLRRTTSWQISGTFMLSSLVGVIAGAGRYGPDPWLAHPGGQYVTLSLRVGFQPEARARLRARTAPVVSATAGFDLSEAGPGQWRLRVYAPLAQVVEVMGDFTDWQVVRLGPAGDGSWTAVVPLAPGTYRFNVRVDGGAWAVPPGLAAAEDEFNGRVGLLIVLPGGARSGAAPGSLRGL